MRKILYPTQKKLLYALIGSSLFCQWSVYAAEDTAQEQTVQNTTVNSQGEFTLDGVEVTADKASENKGYVAKRSSIGTKTDTPLSETAQSISVVTRKQLDTRAVQNLDEAVAYTPGVTASLYGRDATRGYSYVKIRGFSSGVNSTFTDGLRAPVGVFATTNTDTYGFDRIEVLRGPASILYGANSPGGLFNQVTKLPPTEELHEIQLQAGNNANRSAALDIGGPVRDDGKLLFRLTARTQEQDYEQDYSSGRHHFFAPALTYKPDENTSLTLLANYQKDDNKGNGLGNRRIYSYGDALYGYSSSLFTGEPNYDRFVREQRQIGYILEHKFNDTWSLTQTARHTDVDVDYKYIDYTDLDADGRTLNRSATYIKETMNADTIDTHAQAKWSGGALTHTTLIGFDYMQQNYDYRLGTGTAPSLDLATLNYGQAVTTPTLTSQSLSHMRQRGLYVQDQMKLGERWVALVGGRRDWYEEDLSAIKQTANTGRAGLVYHATSELSPYLSYSESFEAQPGIDRSGNTFVPTTGRQYEVGIQYEPTGKPARFTAALFDLRQQNVLTTDPVDINYSIQTGEMASKGLELEANLGPFKGLNLTAAYTLLDNKVTKSTTASEIGRQGQGISRHSASLWADYTISNGKLKGLGFGGGLRYIGSRYDYYNTRKFGGVIVTDAMVRYDLDEWRLALNVRNLFDKFYDASSSYAGEGRTVLLTATRHW
jgi:iron complex outermembrane receptor protein